MTTARKTAATKETDESVEGNPEVEALESFSTTVTLLDGTNVEIERLKTRQLFRLLKVLTVGANDFLGTLQLSADTDTDEFAGNLIAALAFAVPAAEDESMDFILSMVTPSGIIEGSKLSKNEAEINIAKFAHIQEVLFNPEIEDTLAIIERIIRIEAPHIQSLGKKISQLLKVQNLATTAKQGGSSKKTSEA